MLPAGSLLDAPADSLEDPEWASAARQALQQADARLYLRSDQGDNIERLIALRARAADHPIRLVRQRCPPAGCGPLGFAALVGYEVRSKAERGWCLEAWAVSKQSGGLGALVGRPLVQKQGGSLHPPRAGCE